MTTRILAQIVLPALFGLVSLLAASGQSNAQLFETRAQQAVLLDANTGTVLYTKNADDTVPPASLAKMMTMEVVFNALKSGRLNMDDEFLVSEYAWRTGGAVSGGSTMFAELNSSIRLEDLIKGVIVQSANDGCIIIAEGMAGSEDNFARLMTERARNIGLEKSVFKNSTGLPAEGQVVTMRELAKLANYLQREYPDLYKLYSLREFTWNKITQRNRNPLLAMGIGADGVKTGFTEESGYAIVGSVKRDGRRLIAALSGMTDERTRAEEARKILDWGVRAFESYELFKKDELIGNVRLYGGEMLTVPVTVREDLEILLPITERDRMKARVVYQGPVKAPVRAGDQIAALKIWIGDDLSQETPLYAAESVGKGPIHRQALDAMSELVLGWF
ncbi:D-alanyl-D-alanine carboxypeptidase family protein [Oricola cellulosilytica]|uniref:serine-type D-Ala-D-Ala carboxypeptidase n=1 Tax=Oricola cellulosilytica TaxID=1429082 RepID=A0A4R0PAC5_9HYPH|nr:D-alanyl-D-alanine carboxypeptidase family protein [Oricola cellulosilytica]TCD13157.1 D-alanyl-D-alanine carboxypeptidase [Oricola cellulosilytica]